MTLLDTTIRSVDETAAVIEEWVRARLGPRDDRNLDPERVVEGG
jgi:hypothetical protein